MHNSSWLKSPCLKKRCGIFRTILILLIAQALIASACSTSAIQALISTPTSIPATEVTKTESAPILPAAEITFRVTIPGNTPIEEPVYLNILDEVTGLALSAKSYPMQIEDDTHYILRLPVTIGSVVKYRYSRKGEGAPVNEHIADGRPVRYRMVHVEGPAIVQDVVSRWTDTPFVWQSGRIMGEATDQTTGQPIPNLLVTAGGAQALTASNGSFLIEGLPPGTHNLVAYAMDGSYRTFQQGARVEAGSTTPAPLHMASSTMVKLVFVVSVPSGTIPAVPIRLAGNLYQLGNTFADLSGGVSTIASRMPSLTVLPDGRYTITLSLPAGADIRYLYTLGDGLWNTEKFSAGTTSVRQLIVPENNTQINDTIESWVTKNSAPITFDVTVPVNTPTDDSVSIQFNPLYGWTEPIPMWRLSSSRWAYVLNSLPFPISGFHYRVCRNDQCGVSDDSQTMGNSSPGYPVTTSDQPQIIKYTVNSWAWLSSYPISATVNGPSAAVRGSSFFAGIEFQPTFHPSWSARMPNALNEVKTTGSNWLVLTPTWSYTQNSPPILEVVSGRDPFWNDTMSTISQGQERGLNVALFPTPQFPSGSSEWWTSATRDFSWWVVWFDLYRNFILNYADMAERSGSQALIMGGDWLGPALPGGKMADGSASGVPADAESRWRQLIQDVRSRYKGTLMWAIPNSQAVGAPPAFLDAVDQIYLLFSERISNKTNPTPEDLQADIGSMLDSQLLPFQTRLNKPLILAAAYPSATGSATGCIQDPQGSCINFDLLEPSNPDISTVQLNLQEQADIYNALFIAVNQRTWISGLSARGFYPPAILQDKSISIHGKLSQNVISYWFPLLTGAATP